MEIKNVLVELVSKISDCLIYTFWLSRHIWIVHACIVIFRSPFVFTKVWIVLYAIQLLLVQLQVKVTCLSPILLEWLLPPSQSLLYCFVCFVLIFFANLEYLFKAIVFSDICYRIVFSPLKMLVWEFIGKFNHTLYKLCTINFHCFLPYSFSVLHVTNDVLR